MKVNIGHRVSGLVKWGLSVGLVLVFAGFANQKQGERTCQSIEITIHGLNENPFINEEDVLNILTDNGERFVLDASFRDLDLKFLEKSIGKNPFVKRADIYKDLKGTLIVEIEQVTPLARIMISGSEDYYIDIDGQLFPESERYTARVPLILGSWTQKFEKGKIDKDSLDISQIKNLLDYIYNDPFWKAQVAQLHINEEGFITITTQVSKQLVEFGSSEGYLEKFEKLRVFYKDILPRVGWNTYDRVNLAFQNQIICE